MDRNGASGNRDGKGKAAAGREDQEEGQTNERVPIPLSTVVRMMRRVLAAHAKISYPAKNLAASCAAEFIGAVVGDANKRCGGRQAERTTLTPEDLALSLRSLGLDRYVGPMGTYLRRYREAAARNGAGASGSGSGTQAVDEITDDELLAILAQMIDEDAGGDGSA